MLGVIVNAAAIIVAALLGTLAGSRLSEKMQAALYGAVGLVTLYVGISGMLDGHNAIVLILSMVLGTVIGTLIDIDKWLNRLGAWVESKFRRDQEKAQKSLAEGFVSGTLLFCIGAMGLVGSIESGVTGNHTILFSKSAIDFVAAAVMASTLGIGVALSGVSIFLVEGAMVLLATVLQPLLSDVLVAEMSAVGSLIIVAIGLNLLKLTKLKIANMVPAVFLVPLFLWLYNLVF